MKAPQKQLAQKLNQAAAQVTVGARYEHYKEQIYKVLTIALREEDSEPSVIYQAEYGEHIIWSRSVKNWLGIVEVDGKKVSRFKKLDD